MTRLRFITLEGGDGAGKSTQIARIADALRISGQDVLTTREPGGSAGANDIRHLLMNGETDRWLPMSEILMFYAARYDHVERVIKPALDAGKWVISDRFFDTTTAIQGYGYGFDRTLIETVRRCTIGDFAPGLTLVLDIDPETGLDRAVDHQRFERMGLDFHRRVNDGFLAIAAAEPDRCSIVDARQDPDTISAALLAEISVRYGLAL